MGEVTSNEFVRRFSKSLLEGDAALFAGAGLSIPAGFADWRKLLKVIASDLGLNIEWEYDLIAVAQYELNRKGTRDSLNEAIIREFDREARLTKNHEIIARLPFETIWTTNYDRIFEKAYLAANKRLDIKITPSQLTLRKPHSDATLFKMHGDVEFANDAVLTKDDYERYEIDRGAFTVQLLADLIAKRFLFLGFSFTDPNIEYILNRLRRLLNPNVPTSSIGREHYCIFRRPHKDDYNTSVATVSERPLRFESDIARFRHRIADMTRFGIQSVVVDDYAEINNILTAIQTRVLTRCIFISGAAYDYAPMGRDRLEQLVELLAQRLIEEDFDIVSGVGMGVGAAVMIGAQKALSRPDTSRLGQRLRLFPFPYWHSNPGDRSNYYAKSREEMSAQAGVSIFIAGNKLSGSSYVESTGMLDELTEANKNGHYILPIGATGHIARRVWDELIADSTSNLVALDVNNQLAILGDISKSNAEIIDAVLDILRKIQSRNL